MSIDASDILTRRVAGFQAFLREHGFQGGIPEAIDTLTLAGCVDITDKRRFKAGLKSLLCSGHGDWVRYDDLFDAYWLPPNKTAYRETAGSTANTGRGDDGATPRGLIEDVRQGGGEAGTVAGDGATQGGASSHESEERKDFRFITSDEELHAIERLIDRLAARMRRRIVRRQQIAKAGRQLHLRRTLRNSLQFGGLPIDLSYRRRRHKAPHLVMLLDVSRSMSIYTYLLLRFTQAIVRGFRQADAFVFHTRLVSVTAALKEQNTERMRDRLMLLSSGWSGGTRIGESIESFNQKFASQLIGRKTIVMILSDGFDTGDPALLGDEVRKLHSRAKRVVWLNPLLGRQGYEPTAAGMSAALPHVDLFAPAHNLESLLALERELTRL